VFLRSIVGTVVGVEVGVGGEDDVFEVVARVVESRDVGDEGSVWRREERRVSRGFEGQTWS